MEKFYKYKNTNSKDLVNHFKFENNKWVYKTNETYVRIISSVNDLRYAHWGLQPIWVVIICFPFGNLQKTFRRSNLTKDSNKDLVKLENYINKKLSKHNFEKVNIFKDTVKVHGDERKIEKIKTNKEKA